MNKEIKTPYPNLLSNKEQLNTIKSQLLDPLAIDLINKVKWLEIKGFSRSKSELFPVVNCGKGPTILLLHGFDSCFLEFRRLVPLLSSSYQILIPDLYGFGFAPRAVEGKYNAENIVKFINQILLQPPGEKPIGIIGASMGGALAMEVARNNPKLINRLLLLSPAGLTGKRMKVPWPLDQIGVCILSNPYFRKKLCEKAFSNPKINVNEQEEQIASIHLKVPGWRSSLAAFARSGGVANYGYPLPSQPIKVLWGSEDNILTLDEKIASKELLKNNQEEIKNCGHLPHLEYPQLVADKWKDGI